MQDAAFVRAVYNAIPDDHSYLEIVTSGGSFMIQPQRLLFPGDHGHSDPRWASIVGDADDKHVGSTDTDCFVIEGKEVDLEDKQDPFYLKARAFIDVAAITAVVERWIG